jgi:acyl-CoA dehydrogenase
VRDFWLSRAANGKAIAAFALTEPTAGSDVAGIQTTARRDGESYIIDGRKRFISNAGIADFYTVFAKTGTREDGARCFLLSWLARRCRAFESSNEPR